MLFDPPEWLFELMELTWMSIPFRGFIVALAVCGFAIQYAAERVFLPKLAKLIGVVRNMTTERSAKGEDTVGKKRKEYKIILEGVRAKL